MVFGFFRRKRRDEEPPKGEPPSVKELRKLLKEGKAAEVVKLLKDRHRENAELTALYFEALVEAGKREEAEKLLKEVGKENLPPSAVAKLLEEPKEEKKESLLEKFKRGLRKTREWVGLSRFFSSKRKVDEEFYEELEELLIKLDLGVDEAVSLVEEVRKKGLTSVEEVKEYLKKRFKEVLSGCRGGLNLSKKPSVILFVGVNGSGKTTSVGKLAYKLTKEGKKVLVVAADTFRAAATEQLKVWAERAKADFVGDGEGADPGAVLYRGLKKAFEEGYDAVLVDTAGRLHTKEHLLREMQKLVKVVKKFDPEGPSEVLLVLDATIGQNSINQAKMFSSAVDLTGIILTKLDGTAKGGAVIPICKKLKLPVKFVGVGEGVEDLQPFDPDKFVEAMFD
ncbi:MAG: signal recognition particle-docking protein FtsY [Aquificae bacterium]|nr:signal recognition particle-docking protein FtsY [Aquificota bacterium]